MQLVRELDRHALAIELVAARAAHLSPAQILLQLQAGSQEGSPAHGALDVTRMGDSGEGAPERHRSLRAVFNSSFHALSTPQQLLLARLSVFRGGWTCEAACFVCGQESGDVLDGLGELCAASLVIAREWDVAPQDSETRFFLPEVLRAYAGEKLAARDDEQPFLSVTFPCTLGAGGTSDQIIERHLHTTGVLFCDGHVKSLGLNALAQTNAGGTMRLFTVQDD